MENKDRHETTITETDKQDKIASGVGETKFKGEEESSTDKKALKFIMRAVITVGAILLTCTIGFNLIVVSFIGLTSLDSQYEMENNLTAMNREFYPEWFLGDVYYEDYFEEIERVQLDLYNPPNKRAYEKAYQKMTSLMTNACAQSYQRQLGAYQENKKKTVTIDKIDIAFPNVQHDGDGRILVRLAIQEGSNTTYLTTEYKYKQVDGLIYSYEMW